MLPTVLHRYLLLMTKWSHTDNLESILQLSSSKCRRCKFVQVQIAQNTAAKASRTNTVLTMLKLIQSTMCSNENQKKKLIEESSVSIKFSTLME